ncbi:MAG TPA: 4Fe-4S dicluster domain-containing protein [Bacteroidales bacterium]|nr:4Fe-4S dicluster domain-containing protein [Bacteroidales bacterium]HPS63879.1 4Fe-4S dicluster domain-containing protein [Bacteroidales bacterium]
MGVEFGYSVLKDDTIDLDRNDVRIGRYLLRNEPSANLCIGCGSCTATCSTGHFTTFNIRRLHTLVRRGETGTLRKEIARCMLCGKCQLVCPRGVNLRNVILTINRALEHL